MLAILDISVITNIRLLRIQLFSKLSAEHSLSVDYNKKILFVIPSTSSKTLYYFKYDRAPKLYEISLRASTYGITGGLFDHSSLNTLIFIQNNSGDNAVLKIDTSTTPYSFVHIFRYTGHPLSRGIILDHYTSTFYGIGHNTNDIYSLSYAEQNNQIPHQPEPKKRTRVLAENACPRIQLPFQIGNSTANGGNDAIYNYANTDNIIIPSGQSVSQVIQSGEFVVNACDCVGHYPFHLTPILTINRNVSRPIHLVGNLTVDNAGDSIYFTNDYTSTFDLGNNQIISVVVDYFYMIQGDIAAYDYNITATFSCSTVPPPSATSSPSTSSPLVTSSSPSSSPPSTSSAPAQSPTPTPTSSTIQAIKYMTTFAGKGSSGYTGDRGPASDATLNIPLGMALDTVENILYFAEKGNNVIRMIFLNNNTIATFSGTGASGYSGDGSKAINAKFNTPFGVCLDQYSNVLYVADKGNNVVRAINRTTGIITTFAGNYTRGAGFSNGVANNSLLNQPVAVDVDANYVYISDQSNYCIRRVDRVNNTMTRIAGNRNTNRGSDGVLATNSAINAPSGIAVDAIRNLLYIADQYNHAIRVVNLTNMIINTVAGSSNAKSGYSGDGNYSNNALLTSPSSVTLDSVNDLLFICDQGNNVIRVVNRTAGNVISTFAGNYSLGASYVDNKTIDSVGMSNPFHMVIDYAR
ncbi:NHL repeat-containing protein, partial [Acrasis kona]